jgi:hypothetical protein
MAPVHSPNAIEADFAGLADKSMAIRFKDGRQVNLSIKPARPKKSNSPHSRKKAKPRGITLGVFHVHIFAKLWKGRHF